MRDGVAWGSVGWGEGGCTRCLLTWSEVGVCLYACMCGSVRRVLGRCVGSDCHTRTFSHPSDARRTVELLHVEANASCHAIHNLVSDGLQLCVTHQSTHNRNYYIALRFKNRHFSEPSSSVWHAEGVDNTMVSTILWMRLRWSRSKPVSAVLSRSRTQNRSVPSCS